MKHRTGVAALIAGVLALTSLAASPQGKGQGGQQGGGQGAGQGQQMGGARPADRDRQQDRDRADVPDQDRDQGRDRDRLSAPLGDGDIYGHELMSAQERSEYRKQMQSAKSAEEREALRARHQEDIQARAKSRGVNVAPATEGPIYGGALMTAQERNEYREQLRMTDSDEARTRLIAKHREEMQARAKAKGVALDE